jgi:origin recognition complex subunit 5
MLAIFHATTHRDVRGGSADVLLQVVELAAMRLVVKTSSAAEAMDAGTKWRVNVGWEYVLGVARSVRFDLENYVIE